MGGGGDAEKNKRLEEYFHGAASKKPRDASTHGGFSVETEAGFSVDRGEQGGSSATEKVGQLRGERERVFQAIPGRNLKKAPCSTCRGFKKKKILFELAAAPLH